MNRLPALVVLLIAGPPAAGREPIPDRLVVLTFDDASKSHYAVARPLLLKHKFGATFFVTEGWDFATNKTDYMTWAPAEEAHDDRGG
jgi:peptidoglycan/xylan/chitin deacetylase (PgdA/CDA1 family)